MANSNVLSQKKWKKRLPNSSQTDYSRENAITSTFTTFETSCMELDPVRKYRYRYRYRLKKYRIVPFHSSRVLLLTILTTVKLAFFRN